MKDFRYSGWLMPGRAAPKDAVSPGDVTEVHEVVRRAQTRLHRTKKKQVVSADSSSLSPSAGQVGAT